MESIILVKKGQLGKPLFVQFRLTGATLAREYGQVGSDNIQSTSHTYSALNVGKANEKVPVQVAREDFERIVQAKKKEGYIEVANLDDLSALDQEESFDIDNIPEAFCISKPHATITQAAMDKLLGSGNGKFFIKYNGIGHFIQIRTDGEIRIFTRRWCDHTAKYPEIIADIKSQNYPVGTLIYAEFIIDPSLKIPHMDAFSLMAAISKTDVVNGVCKPDVTETLELQKKHRVRAALLIVVYAQNEPVYTSPYQTILNSLRLRTPAVTAGRATFVPTEVPISTSGEAKALVEANKHIIEGLVLWDMTKGIEVTMNGKPNRTAAYKVKYPGETDVIAYGYLPGKGRFQEMIGSLKICQFDMHGNPVDLGTVGGLKDEERDPDDWTFPCVIEVQYDQRFPNTGKFQFARFSKRHEDKVPEDVGRFSC